METNKLPKCDIGDNPTNWCPRFHPLDWDQQELNLKDKLFIKTKTRSIFYIPINLGSIFQKTFTDIKKSNAQNDDELIVLSYDPSAWTGEHLFTVTKEVPGYVVVKLSGDYFTKVFEGPYKNAPKWEKEMKKFIRAKGRKIMKNYFFFTTCPKCANFMVKIIQLLFLKFDEKIHRKT